MNAHTILNKLRHAVTANMHKTRRHTLSDCVFSLINGTSATVTRIGRSLEGWALEKHNIKRTDRLCSSIDQGAEQRGDQAISQLDFS